MRKNVNNFLRTLLALQVVINNVYVLYKEFECNSIKLVAFIFVLSIVIIYYFKGYLYTYLLLLISVKELIYTIIRELKIQDVMFCYTAIFAHFAFYIFITLILIDNYVRSRRKTS